jgi:hypothetical protein
MDIEAEAKKIVENDDEWMIWASCYEDSDHPDWDVLSKLISDFGRKCHAEGLKEGKLEAVIGDAEAVTAYKNGYEKGKAEMRERCATLDFDTVCDCGGAEKIAQAIRKLE